METGILRGFSSGAASQQSCALPLHAAQPLELDGHGGFHGALGLQLQVS